MIGALADVLDTVDAEEIIDEAVEVLVPDYAPASHVKAARDDVEIVLAAVLPGLRYAWEAAVARRLRAVVRAALIDVTTPGATVFVMSRVDAVVAEITGGGDLS